MLVTLRVQRVIRDAKSPYRVRCKLEIMLRIRAVFTGASRYQTNSSLHSAATAVSATRGWRGARTASITFLHSCTARDLAAAPTLPVGKVTVNYNEIQTVVTK